MLSIFIALSMFLSICQSVLVKAEVAKVFPPLGFKAEASITKINLSWQSKNGTLGYELEADGKVVDVGIKTSYEHNNLLPGSIHVYRIRAKDKDGIGEWSSAINVKTQSIVPITPSDFRITNVTSTTVEMAWNKVLGADSYEVEVDGQTMSSDSKTSFTKDGFNPASKHTFRVRAKNDLGESKWTNEYEVITFPNAPQVPQNLRLKYVDNNNISIVWDTVDGADGYEVIADNKLIDNGKSNEFVHKDISINDTHTYFVRAKNNGGVSELSSGLSTKFPLEFKENKVNIIPEKRNEKASLPKAPSNINLKSTENSITVSWDSLKNVDSYDIEVDGKVISNLKENSYTQRNLTQGTSHAYRVRAKNKNSVGRWSSIVIGFTKIEIPNIPKNLNANAVSSGCIVVAWDTVQGATGYDLEVDGKVVDVGISIKYVNTQLEEESTHYYRVRAKNVAGNSEWSEKITAKTLVKNKSNQNVRNDASSQKNLEDSNGKKLDSDISKKESINNIKTSAVSNVKNNESEVKQVNKTNEVAKDKEIKSTNANNKIANDEDTPPPPANLKSTAATGWTVSLNWDSSTDDGGVDSYDIYCNGEKVGNTKSTSYVCNVAKSGTTYTFVVKAIDKGGNSSGNSNSIDVTTMIDDYGDNINQVATIEIGHEKSGKIDYSGEYDCFSFVAPISGYYTIKSIGTTYMDGDLYDEGQTLIKSVSHGWEYNFEMGQNLVAGKVYYLAVKNPITSTGSYGILVTVEENTVPTIPSNIKVENKSITTVTLSWTSCVDNIAISGYEIYRDEVKIGETKYDTTTYTDTSLNANTTYKYTVRAKDQAGNLSDVSSKISVTTDEDSTPPTAPTNLKSTATTGWKVSLSWDASTDDGEVDSYDIYCNGEKVGNTKSTSYVCSVGKSGTTYTFTVKAMDKGGNFSASSNEINATTKVDDYGDNINQAANIEIGHEKSGKIDYSGEYDYFTFVAPISGSYTIKSTGNKYVDGVLLDTDRRRVKHARYGSDYNFVMIENLVAGKRYYLGVNSSRINTMNYGIIVSVQENEVPTTPENLKVENKSITTVTLSWTSSVDNISIAGYEIYRDGVKIGETKYTTTTYTDTRLNANTTYKYTVRAKDQAGNFSEVSSEISIITDEDSTPPTAPTNLKSTEVTGWTVSLSWDASTDDGEVDSYNIYCNGEKVGNAKSTTYVCSVPKLNTTYTFTVQAVDKGGNNSINSNSINVTTNDDDYGNSSNSATTIQVGYEKIGKINYSEDYDYFVFVAPISASYTIISKGTQYYIYGYLYNSDNKLIKQASNNGNNFGMRQNLIAGKTYYIAVKSYSIRNYSIIVSVQENEVPTAPTNLNIENKSMTTITLSWTSSVDNIAIAGYEIYRDGVKIGETKYDTTTYTDVSLNSNATYKYVIKAKDQAGNLSDASNEISVTADEDSTPPSVPANLKSTKVTGWTVSLSWNASTDNAEIDGYDIYCNGEKVGSTKGTTYICSGLKPNTNDTFVVRAKDKGGNYSEYSNSININTKNDDYGDNADQGTNIEVGREKLGKIDYLEDSDFFIFVAPIGGSYTIRCKGYINYLNFSTASHGVGEMPSGNGKHDIEITYDLVAGQICYIYVKGGSEIPGDYSIMVNVQENEAPTIPTDLKIENKTITTITLSWKSSIDNVAVDGYEIYRDGIKIGETKYDTTTYTDWGLDANKKYKYIVKAKDQAGNLSDASNEISATTGEDTTPPTAPSNLIGTINEYGKLVLTWNASQDNGEVRRYDIYCNSIKIGSSNTTNYTCPNSVEMLVKYVFVVKAIDAADIESLDSNTIVIRKMSGDLKKDTVIEGDLDTDDATNINLNGYRLEIDGNLNQLGGEISIKEGLLIVTGNYKVSNGVSTSGVLRMTYAKDYVQVFGDFTMESKADSTARLAEGILEVKGNFTQKELGSRSNFSTDFGYIVILSGSSVQYISFDSPPRNIWDQFSDNMSNFNILITTKPLSTGYIFKNTYWKHLIENYKIDTNFGLLTDYEDNLGDGTYGPTGNFSKSFTDLKVGNDGADAEFVRTYNSRDIRENSGFGRGWSFSYESNITDYSGNIQTKLVRLPDGSTQSFVVNSDGTFTAIDSRNTLIKQGDEYILKTKDQHTYGFNKDGHLIWIKDRNGNQTTITVDNNGKITNIIDDAGRSYSIFYNELGLINSITDCLGRVVKYEYDNRKLIKVIDPMGQYTIYSYDSNGFLIEIRADDNSLIRSITYNHKPGLNADKVDYTIDEYGNVLTYSYDVINFKTTIKDSNGRKTIQTYDSSYNIISSVDAEGKTTTYEYNKDSSGRNNYGEQKSVTDRNGGVTSYTRDILGNITKITNPDGSYKQYVYDSKNNVIKEIDENGKVTFYVYDSNGINMVKKVIPLNSTDIYSDSADQTKFAITQYIYYSDSEALSLSYRAKGLLKQVIDPMGNITTYSYDEHGNVITVTDAVNNVTTYEYNLIGWKTKVVSPQGYVTEYFYDNNGKIEKTILNHSIVTRTVYDSLGRVIKTVTANIYDSSQDDLDNHNYLANDGTRYTYYSNGKVKTETDAENNTISYTYDIYGNKITETKANGAIYRYVYDVINRVSKVYFKADANSSEQLILGYNYGILSNGSTTKTEIKYVNAVDSLKTTTTVDYAGRVISVQNPDGTTITKVYNANGTLSSSKDANGNLTYYKYDSLNKLIAIWAPYENINGTIYYSYTGVKYDKAGRKIEESFGKDKVLNNKIAKDCITTIYEYYNDGNLKIQSDSAGRRVEYTYDKDGNVIMQVVKVDNNVNKITEYTNNEFGKPTTMKLNIFAGDLYGNAYDDKTNLVLATSYTYDKEGNEVSETYPDNSITNFTYDKLGRLLCTSKQGKDEYGKDVTITTSQTYNWEGKTLTKTDGNGNTKNYVYDARGFLVKMVDSKGNTKAYYYDLAGRKIAEVSPNNYDEAKALENLNRTEYTYDLMDRLKTKVLVYLDKVSNVWNRIITQALKYDNNGNVIKELDAGGYEAGTGSSYGEKINSGYGTTYTYNLANKLITKLDADSKDRSLPYNESYSYDGIGRKTSTTDARGKVTTLYYDDAGNIIKTTIKRLSTEAEVAVSSATYNNTGDVITATDGNGTITTYEYNGFGKIKKVTYAGDNTVEQYYVIYQYDSIGRVIRKQDSLGVVDIYTYDSFGRELSSTEERVDGSDAIKVTAAYDKNGNKRFVTDGNGTVTENTYDELNKLVSSTTYVTDASGNKANHTTRYIYDKDGNLVKEISWLGSEKSYVYDSLNRVVEKYDENNKLIQKLEYNSNGTQSKSYDALENVTLYYYDKNNRLIKTIDPEGHIILQHYDEVGNVDQKTNGNNSTTYYSYDQYNRLVAVKNAKSEITNYTYDLNGNMLTEVDAQGNTTTYEYNVANKVTRKIYSGGRTGSTGNYSYDPLKIESYTYYANGTMSKKVDRNGTVTTYIYDIHGRKLSETIGNIAKSYTYDNNGNQITITDNTGTTKRTYDELNRVTSKSVPEIGTAVYKYDITKGINGLESGNFGESETDPKGNVTIKIYDKTGRIIKVMADKDITTYTYYDNGSLNSVVYPNGYTEQYSYYKDKMLKTLVNKDSSGTIIESYDYTYDNSENMLSKTDKKGITSYTYDELNRLKSVTEPSGKVTTYTYTSAGNRNDETIVEGSNTTIKNYIYDSLNRLLSISTTLNGVTIENTIYTYDSNGNQLTSKVDNYNSGTLQSSQTTTNVYDGLNQLIKVTTPENITIKNLYNGEGLRVQKQVGNSLAKYLYSSDKVVLELDGNGQLIARNIYGINLLERITDNNKAYYFYNGHADTTKLIAEDGTILNSYYYDAFGNITESNEKVDNPYRYAGYQYDKETKTYYIMCRMYDPSTGRFLQEDSYTGDIKDPLSLNLYTYCENEPIRHDDPTGHFLHVAIGAGIGAVVGAAVNLASDIMDDGKINKGWKSYLGSAVEGAIVGGTAAATGGMSLLGSAAAIGTASFAGNVANQYITNKKVNWKEAAISGVLGGVGELGGKILGKIFSNTKAGKAILGKIDNVVSSLKNKLSAVKEKVAQTAEKSLSSIANKLNSFNRKLAVEGININLPSKAFKEMSGMNIGKNDIQKNFLKAVQDGEGSWLTGIEDKGATQAEVTQMSRREAFRQAKQDAGIPKSSQYKTHEYVYDGTSENRTVYEFTVDGKKKYIIEHAEDKMGRGPHFHGADDVKGNPFEKGRYNQYDGHYPEDFNGYKK